jgi:hypothetical protein
MRRAITDNLATGKLAKIRKLCYSVKRCRPMIEISRNQPAISGITTTQGDVLHQDFGSVSIHDSIPLW